MVWRTDSREVVSSGVYGKSEQLLGLCQRGRVPPKEWQNKWAMEGWLHRRSVSYFVSSVAIHSVIEGIVT